jgi:hypothetical protein
MTLAQVAADVDQLHVAFTTIFPHQGVIKIGGARIFLSAKSDISEIRKRVRAIRTWFEHHSSCQELMTLWKETARLVDRVVMAGKRGPSDEINRAFRLFFATTALTYTWLRDQFQAVAERETGGYIDESQFVVAKRTGFSKLGEGTLFDAIRLVTEMERDVLPSTIRRISRSDLRMIERR